MHLRWISAASFLALVAGCTHHQTLRYKEESAVIPAARVNADFRYHFGQGWDLPAAPGTQEAEDREFFVRTPGGGFLMRLQAEYTFRAVTDTDEVRSGETAGVDGVVFTGPEDVKADLRIGRERIGVDLGFFSDKYFFGGGLSLFWSGFQLSGSFKSASARSSPDVNLWGPGIGFYLEGSPGFPPVRFYLFWGTWEDTGGKGFFKGTDFEVGVRGQFRGFCAFLAYRYEQFAGRADETYTGESRLKFDITGLLAGLGVSF